jgi:hypothetical protein
LIRGVKALDQFVAFHGPATATMPLLRVTFAGADDELRTDVAVLGAADLTVRGPVTEPSPATYSRIAHFAAPTRVAGGGEIFVLAPLT